MPNQLLRLSVLTPEQQVYDSQVASVSLPSLDGELTILPGHEPLVALLASGEVTVREGAANRQLAVHGGVVTVSQREVSILTDAAETEESIDEQRAAEALRRAQQAKLDSADRQAQADAAAAIERALVRLRLAERRRLRHRA